jgi:hypothetical protein
MGVVEPPQIMGLLISMFSTSFFNLNIISNGWENDVIKNDDLFKCWDFPI